MRVEDITNLHVAYARAQMNRGAIPLPPIKPKRASVAPEQYPVNATPVDRAFEANVETRPQPPISVAVADPVALDVDVAIAADTLAIEKSAPPVETPFADLASSVSDPAAVMPEPTNATPGTPKNALKASYLAIALAITASAALLTYQVPHPHSHVSEPATKVSASQPVQPKAVMTIPVVPAGASTTIAQNGLNLPYDNVASPDSGTQMNAAPARAVASSAQHQSIVLASPDGVVAHSLTALDLMPNSPRADFMRPASGLAHVDPHDFTGHQSRSAEPDARVAQVQTDGSDDARPTSVYEAPIRKVIRTLHRVVQPAREATAKAPATPVAAAAPAGASAAAARHTTAPPSEADGDQRLF